MALVKVVLTLNIDEPPYSNARLVCVASHSEWGALTMMARQQLEEQMVS